MKIGVIGSGSIGPDLAYGFLSALAREPDARVYLVDIKKEALEAGVERIHGYAAKGVARGKLSPKAARGVKEALVPTMRLEDLAECDYVLESASEDLAIKRKILAQVEQIVGADCLIGFSTSGIPRAEIAAEAQRPERCFVNHPFYPAWRSLPVEVVLSGDEALGARMIATLEKLGKVPIVTSDVACFAADDIFCNYVSEAARIVEEGLATPAQVDRIVDDAVGGGGPLNVMDLTRGNLLTVHCQELMKEAPTGTEWFAPPAILSERGAESWHDRKNPGDPRADEATWRQVLDRILAVLVGRAYAVAEAGVCDPTDLDWMTRMALGFRTGLLSLAEELGAERCRELVTAYAGRCPGFPIPERLGKGELLSFYRTVKTERRDSLGVVRIFRPEVKNALSERTIAEIDRALGELAADPGVEGVILTSEGGALAGADITGIASLETPEACRGICLRAYPVLDRIASSEKPVVAAVDGPVLGGGAELAMACHARVVGPNLAMGQPEVNLGIIPGYGGTQRLPRLVGAERASEILRTGRQVTATEACALGWAEPEPADAPVAAAAALIKEHVAGRRRLAPVSPEPIPVPEKLPAVDLGHRSLAIDEILVDVLRRGLTVSLAEGLEIEAGGFARCKETVDMDIGIKNFMQNGPRVPAAFLHE